MRPRTFTLLATTVAVSVFVLGSIAQAADYQVGVWKLNVANSKYSPGPPPKEMTVTVKSQPNGIKVTAHGTNAEGQPIHYEFSAKYDGKDYPMTGNAEADTISIKKIDNYTNEVSTRKGGTPLLTIRIVVSKDGKTRTSTQTGKNAKGHDVNNTIVYDKQ